MAKIPKAFNKKDHGEMGSFEALPRDDYHVKVKDSKVKDNKARVAALKEGNDIPGKVTTLVFEVQEGEFKGRLLFDGMNLEHTSDQSVEIAFKELNSIKKACGIDGDLNETEELHGKELIMSVKEVPATAQYPASNEATGYHSLKGVKKPKATKGKAEKSGKKDKKGKKKKGPKVKF